MVVSVGIQKSSCFPIPTHFTHTHREREKVLLLLGKHYHLVCHHHEKTDPAEKMDAGALYISHMI